MFESWLSCGGWGGGREGGKEGVSQSEGSVDNPTREGKGAVR